MILVCDVFRLKIGKAKEAKSLWKEATALMKKYGLPEGRALTDPAGAEEWGKWYERFAPLLDGGHREMFTIVE